MSYYVHDLDPLAFSFGWLILPWYWLAYIAGFFIVYFGVFNLIRKKKISLSSKLAHSYLTNGFLSLIVGGRLGYILFYNLSYYIDNPSKIFAVWEGGMSFHGALIAVSVYSYYLSKRENKSLFEFSDPVSLWAPLGIFLGRLANFMNGELAGRVTDVSWAVVFPKFYDQSPRHPSQIYEAISEGIVVFVLMQVLGSKKLAQHGYCSGLFLCLYGLGRFGVEFFRNPDPQLGLFFGIFTLGQFFCLAMIIVGLIIIAKSKVKSVE